MARGANRRAGQQPGNAQTDLNAAQRSADAFRLRAEGWAFEDIATALGYILQDGRPNPSAAYKAYKRALERIPKEAIEEMRANILEQQRVAYTGLLRAIRGGDTFAVDAMTRMHDRQAKLFGLDVQADAQLAASNYTKRIVLEDAATRAREESEPAA